LHPRGAAALGRVRHPGKRRWRLPHQLAEHFFLGWQT